jgi:7-cyano-7-deazaguanine synthase
MIPKTIIHLLSGGLDSVTMLYDLKSQGHAIHCVLVDYSQPHKQELQCAIRNAERCNVPWTLLKVPPLGGMDGKSWVVPNRNALLISLAVNMAVRAMADTVTIGCNADDAENFPDCRKDFIASMNRTVKQAGYDVEICAPYITWRKWEIGGLAMDMGVVLDDIWTCYKGGESPCGECPACDKLKRALP